MITRMGYDPICGRERDTENRERVLMHQFIPGIRYGRALSRTFKSESDG